MNRFLVTLVLLASVAGCEVNEGLGTSAPKKERPTVNVPAALRQSNWRGPQGQGSCVLRDTTAPRVRGKGRFAGE